MTKCYMPLTRPYDDGSVCKSNKPTATVIPESIKPYSTVIPSKCPAINLARQKEDEVFKVFSKALQMYKPNQIMFSFNGGKDCTVVLHMLNKFFQNNALKHIRIPVLYIQTDDNFPEIDLFVDESTAFYNIDLIKRKGCIKAVLTEVIKEMPNIKAVIMGNRRTDPYCSNIEVFQACDPGWPKLMRINPIIDWSYSDVWTYIFVFKVPYCVLYEKGYTSIGTKKNTIPNPHLKIFEHPKSCPPNYHPAYMLEDESLERAGRCTAPKKEQLVE